MVAHIARRPAAELLAEQLDAYLSVDDGARGAVGNHRHVWGVLVDAATDWVCVVEDDAEPIPEFRQQLGAALAVTPTPVVSLYLGTSRPPSVQARVHTALARADRIGAMWITSHRMLHAVGICLRAELITDMLTHTRTTPARVPADTRLDRWLRARRLQVAYSVPSLVDHHDGPTLLHHSDGQARDTPRRAWRVGPRSMWTPQAVSL
ncbi:hypothetical protein NDR87_26420 [Nocardia sp. CDC159]|uniref:Uncharacterized protein n=1 Tax=Nocardia pulmonis TaxID=2951408 RepID=A0A9X2IX38_9NOCA|nr:MULTISPECIES: hypothetical protein [Nocardia]MCM6774983.1 hypothetical protein [Nocardia pulmonis]MCM6789914.1 hypothetical protein [Nocardia sp. CDC159]